MNFYSFHIGDYAAHTRNLSLIEDLAYRRLLDAYYLAERPFNGSSTDVAREIGMREQIAEVEYVLGKFFELEDGVWRNKRADAEIAKYREKLCQASRAGKASAERRSNARSTSVDESVNARSTSVGESGNGRATNQEPRTKNHTSPTESSRATRLDPALQLPVDWAEFCKAERPDLNPLATFDRFRDYWTAKPGKAGTKLDWMATWRNWVREERQQRNATLQAETTYQRSMRERMQQAAPEVARKAPGAYENVTDFFLDVAAKTVEVANPLQLERVL